MSGLSTKSLLSALNDTIYYCDCDNFGMTQYYDWRGNIKINILLMKLMGLWPKGDQIYKPNPYLAYIVSIMIFFVCGHIFSQAINIYFLRNHFESVVGIIYVIMIECMAAIKAFFVIRNMETLKKCVATIKSDWFQPKTDDQRLMVEPSISFWKTVYRMLMSMCFSCNAFYSIYPLLDTTAGEKRLPFLAWYPFDFKKSPFYECAYVFQIISTSYLTLIHVNVDTIISGFNVYIGCQFDMLGDGLRNMGNVKKGMSCDFGKNIVECVIQHKKILTFVEDCSKFFNWILFWHLIISGVSIGITMFELTLVVPFTNEFYSLVSYGFAIIIQIFMYCWFGNEVEVKSSLVAYAVFESNWMELPIRNKKDLLFFTINLMKPVKISAFNIFQLSLDTFMRILKTAWSYFALLYQLSLRD